MEQSDDHNNQTQAQQPIKRKLPCCERNEVKRKVYEVCGHACLYCECMFREKADVDNHTRAVHKCPVRDELEAHKLEEEKRLRDEQQQKRDELRKQRTQKEDDLVRNFVKTNKLDEYQPDPNHSLDIEYILNEYIFDNEELLRFVKKFDVEDILGQFFEDEIAFDKIIYLMENEAVSVEYVSSFLDYKASDVYPCYHFADILPYFLDKGYAIKPEWVATIIDEKELVERIKQKYTFTFDEIHDTRTEIMLDGAIYNEDDRKQFYLQVHKHFPDPDFENPYADPYINFKQVSTEHVNDHLHSRYFYDEEGDDLSIVISSCPDDYEISLGKCKEMLEMDLQDLINQYNEAITSYEEANREVSALFEQKEIDLHDGLTENQRLSVLDDYDHILYRDALPERNHCANIVSKLYFVIAQK